MQQQLLFIGMLIAIIISFSIVEAFVPAQYHNIHRRLHSLPNSILTILTLALGALLSAGAVIFATLVEIHQFALLNFDLPFWVVLLIGIGVLDFFAYLAHRLMHLSPILWRFHRVHHSDLLVDATTSFRQHPLEGVWRFLFTIIPSWVIGIPPEVIAIYKGVSALNAIFEHTNIAIWMPLDRAISTIFVTPNMHKIHHSDQQTETDSNYGNILAFYDRSLGTFKPQRPPEDIHYGLEQYDDPKLQSSIELLRMPFK